MAGEAGTVAVERVESRREQRESPLYKGRVEVYAKAVRGKFRTLKWAVLGILLGLYYLAPWIRWERPGPAPDQAILADFSTRRIYFFWLEIWPQEVYYLTGILMLAAFGLFLASALFGRVWCGFTCPQTVWTDLFMTVERWIEGDRNQRMRFDKAPWTTQKILKRSAKHAVWLFIAFWTGGAWIMYFNDAPTVTVDFWTGQASAPVYFFTFLFAATTYLLAGMAREQVCTYMCPWPRIQGSLVDHDTLAVTYQAWRGEPRGSHKKGESWENRGDCVACRQCVAVCPMGIDIRDGFQLECIGCGLCIDACNEVMAKVDRPPDLITYDSERNMERQAAGQERVVNLIRPRTMLYAGVVLLVGAVMLGTLATRADTDVNILPERNPLFVQLADGSIRNSFTFKILNMDNMPRTWILEVADLPDARLARLGDEEPSTRVFLDAPPDGVGTHRVHVIIPSASLTGSATTLNFILEDSESGEQETYQTIFRGPETGEVAG
ncbi:MAG: cytochrome c oxidase accessory protein CcoG [Geminicoccaceae bacterium]|nr:cytochrome c oxidase accessory protein CcoG [Geminicoccaceae bacterium]